MEPSTFAIFKWTSMRCLGWVVSEDGKEADMMSRIGILPAVESSGSFVPARPRAGRFSGAALLARITLIGLAGLAAAGRAEAAALSLPANLNIGTGGSVTISVDY